MSKQQSILINQWQNKGYQVINLINVTPKGIPDLICVKPNHVVFVESKEKWDSLSPLQRIRLNMLTRLGFECYVNNDRYTTK